MLNITDKGVVNNIIETKKRPHASKSAKAVTMRRKKLTRALASGTSLKQAAIEAGISPKSASATACHIINHEQTRVMFRDLMEKEGLSDKILTDKLRTLLDAKQKVFFQKDGIVTDTREIEALETQRKTLELSARLKGHLAQENATPDITINIMGAVINALKGDQD